MTEQMYNNYFNYMGKKLIAGSDRVNKATFERTFKDNYNIITRKCLNMTYSFTNFKKLNKNGRVVYVPTIRDRIVLEHLKNCLVQKYKLKTQNRNHIIDELKILCEEKMHYYIIRTDIDSFFSKINHEKLLDKLLKSSLLNINQINLIKNLLKKMPNVGIPQGIGISNYLAELYLENFDFEIKSISPRVFYYSRYVDDIILIIPGKINKLEKNVFQNKLEDIFKKYDLEINKKKTKYLDFTKENSNSFDYLGYSFQRVDNKLIMEIADYKIHKLKVQIDNIFDNYTKTLNYNLLFERLKLFTSVNQINKNIDYFTREGQVFFRRKTIRYGINVDYKYASYQSIDRINNYIKYKIIHASISREEKNNLYKILIQYNDMKFRLIVYEKISIKSLRSMVYRITTHLTWRNILKLNKNQLLLEYFNILNINC